MAELQRPTGARRRITLGEVFLSLSLLSIGLGLIRCLLWLEHVNAYELLMPHNTFLIAASYFVVCSTTMAVSLPVGRLIHGSECKTMMLLKSGALVGATLWTAWVGFLYAFMILLSG